MSAPPRVLVVGDSEDDAFRMLAKLRRGGFHCISRRVEKARSRPAERRTGDRVTKGLDVHLRGRQ